MNGSLFLITLLIIAGVLPVDAALARDRVRIGVTNGPQAEIMQQVKNIAAGRDLDLQIVPYASGGSINRELAAGRIDAASFQDGVALDAEVARYRYPLIRAALTVTLPIGLYSRKIGNLNALRPGATVAIPENRIEAARALMLLHNYGLLEFRDGAGLKVSLRDIVKNPRKLRFVERPTGELAGRLDHATLVALDYSAAFKAGRQPARDAIGMEDGRSPYAGVLAIRAADQGKPWVARLVSAYHSEEIKRFILTRYRDSVRRPW